MKKKLEIYEVTSGACVDSSCKPPETPGDECGPNTGWPCGPGN